MIALYSTEQRALIAAIITELGGNIERIQRIGNNKEEQIFPFFPLVDLVCFLSIMLSNIRKISQAFKFTLGSIGRNFFEVDVLIILLY